MVRRRIEGAYKNLEVAKTLHSSGLYEDSISQSYYAIFFAAKALLLTKGFDPKKHSGVISHFNQHFVKTREIDKEFADILKYAQKERLSADYDELYSAGLKRHTYS